MPSIYLKQTGTYNSGSTSVNVTCDEYPNSNLFTRYKHEFTSAATENIWIYNGQYEWSKYFTIKPGTTHTTAKLTEAHVYFNKFDENFDNPLLFVLKFNGGSGLDKYYKASEFKDKFSDSQTEDIKTLTKYDGDDKSILDKLLEENDKLTHLLTFNIGKTQGEDESNDILSNEYNNNKIIIEDSSRDHPVVSGYGFKKYKHKPQKGGIGKNACVIYNKDLLIGESTSPLDIQNKNYQYINVYYSNDVSEPLLFEFEDSESNFLNTHKYYYHTWKKSKVLYWQEIKKSEKVLNVKFDLRSDIYSQLSGTTNGKLLELLKAIESHLQKTIIIMVDKRKSYKRSDFKESFPKSSNYRIINQQIKVTDKTDSLEGKCLENTGFRVYEHDFSASVNAVVTGQETVRMRLIIPNSTHTKYREIAFKKTGNSLENDDEILKYDSSNKKIYVYFYDRDPRTLLICYGSTAYKPRNNWSPQKNKPVNVDYSEWVRVTEISKCTCNNGGTTGPNQHILKALNDVVGFLNPVQINPNQIPSLASTQITQKPPSPPVKAEYDLHTYIPKTTIKMGITRQDVGCYNKYTYQPYGTSGSRYDNTFRLGTVFHGKTSQSNKHSPLEYINHSSYKYYPVVGVTVYYYDADKEYNDPLLIELEFKNGVGNGGANPKEYYKLSQTGDSSSGTLEWQLDPKASSAINGVGDGDNNQNLITYLDGVRHSLKPVIKILIDKQQTYGLCLSNEKGGSAATYGPANGGSTNIQVDECSGNGCQQLSDRGYKCYQHKVSALNGGGFDYNSIGGLKFFISGSNTGGASTGDIEIKLYNNGDSGGEKQITYNQCMGDVYVFFYCKPTFPGPESTPTAPLMLYYNKGYYKPENIDKYFTKWVLETGLTSVTAPCGGNNGNHTQLANKLNEVNKSLNRINLGPSTVSGISATKQYGIPAPQPPPKNPNIVLNRIKVTKIPGKDNCPYCKLVHRTSNGFTIGDIWYNNKDITKGAGVTINGPPGSGNITVDGGSTGNHTSFVNPPGTNNPNTVVAYYHTEDKTHTLPQLIVLLQTEGEISAGTTITTKAQTKYGYYVLATNNTGGNTYKYEWRTVESVNPDPFKLDEQTEFSLLNSLVILVEKQSPYNEGVISSAVKTLQIKSPGNKEGVNRLQGRNIDVSNETETTKGKCVSTYGYLLKSHDLTAITAPIHGIKPILGLRFLIPSDKTEGSYDEVTLYQDEEADLLVGPLYHTSSIDKVYVYFYGSDPRPLLMCYEKSAYIPKKNDEPTVNKQVDVDYTKWTLESKIKQCTCNGEKSTDNNKEILDSLLEVVCFLNPVQLNPTKIPTPASAVIISESPKAPGKTSITAIYKLHQFTPKKTVKMKITRESVECYEKYTYESNGTSSSGTGFRLGKVIYDFGTDRNKRKSIVNYFELSPSSKYNPLLKVTVYYYDHDKKYEEPLLIELMFKFEWSFEISYKKEYYKLASATGTGPSDIKWTIDSAARGAIGDGKDGDNQKLITYLDTIRYGFKKVLEIKIAIKKSESYQANLLNRENGSAGESEPPIQVPVSEETSFESIKDTGFRCFKHKITELESDKLHKFAALQFVIPGKDSAEVNLNLYKGIRTDPTNPLYYNCGMGDIYVYFYGGTANSGQPEGDPRPLLLCYNKRAYRAFNIALYDIQRWFKASHVKKCVCNKPGDEFLLRALVRVSNFLNPVKLNITQGIYKIHKFNGKEISIQVSVTKAENKFCYYKYTHEHNGTGNSPESGKGFRLGNITYNSEWIVDLNYPDKCITSLTSKSPKYDPASEVVVYYYRGDANHKNPLLVVLCSNSCPSGTTSCTCKPYYELLRDVIGNRRKYKKHLIDLSLDPSKNGKLEQILDKILFNISKRLQIILGERPDPIKLCPIERKRIKLPEPKKSFKDLDYPEIIHQLVNDTVVASTQMSQAITETILSSKNPKSYEYMIEKNCENRQKDEWDPKIKTRTPFYNAKVYNNTGTRESGDSGTAQIKVQKIDCPGLSDKGYVCYRHKLLNIPNINEFNGLRLFLWDNRTSDDNDSQCKITQSSTNTKPKCCELDLHENGTQPSDSSCTKKIEPIAYTTCKGDLYVYFYGSDPRPMLLCYNGQSYAPQSMDEYNQKWCLVKVDMITEYLKTTGIQLEVC